MRHLFVSTVNSRSHTGKKVRGYPTSSCELTVSAPFTGNSSEEASQVSDRNERAHGTLLCIITGPETGYNKI